MTYLELKQKVAVYMFDWEFFLYQASNDFSTVGRFYIFFFIFFVCILFIYSVPFCMKFPLHVYIVHNPLTDSVEINFKPWCFPATVGKQAAREPSAIKSESVDKFSTAWIIQDIGL